MNPLNSPLEVGMRALVLLAESHPEPLDLGQLVLFDYALLHSSELDGPPSLHPELPARAGELGMKRNVLEEALLVLIRAELAEIEGIPQGLVYSATEQGTAFVDVLEAPYMESLRRRAEWVIHGYARGTDVRTATREIINRRPRDTSSADQEVRP